MKSRPELAAANSALEACAALFRAQDADRDRQSRCAGLDRQTDGEHKRLDALASWVESTMGPMIGEGKPAIGAAAAAAAIQQCARNAIAAQRQALAERRDQTTAQLARGYDSRALRNALDRYFGHFELAGTRWSLRWQRAGDGPPAATAIASAPGEIEAEFPIAVPQGPPWWQPARLAELADPGASRMTDAQGRPVSPAKLWIAGVTWHMGCGTLLLSRSKRKLAGPILVHFPDGAPLVSDAGPDGATPGPACPVDRATADYLEAVWSKLSSAAEDLIAARGSATSIKHKGYEIETLPSPGSMADAMLAALGPALRRIREDHAGAPEVIEALRRKFDDLPDAYRAAVDRAGLGDPDEAVSFDDEAMTMPFLASGSDDTADYDLGDSLFGSSTIDETIEKLDLEGTLPGHHPGANREVTAPL